MLIFFLHKKEIFQQKKKKKIYSIFVYINIVSFEQPGPDLHRPGKLNAIALQICSVED